MARKKDPHTKSTPTHAASRSIQLEPRRTADATVSHPPPAAAKPAPAASSVRTTDITSSISSILVKVEFPLAVLASFVLSTVLYGFVVDREVGLGRVNRKVEGWVIPVGLLGWRVLELGLGRYGGLGVQDVAIFTFLSHLPQIYLLRMFYRVHIVTALKLIVIDLFSLTFPIALLHRLPLTQFLASLSTTFTNLSIPITLLTSAIYALVAYASFLTWAPAHLSTHFHGIRDISLVYGAQFPHLICYFLPVGMAVVAFVYNPAAAAPPRPNTKDAKVITAPWQKLPRENWKKLTPRTQEIVKRTAAVIVIGGGKSWLHTCAVLKGVDAFGAAGYTGIFEVGALVTGIVYWWVGDV